jgi:hypothetical protein
MGAVRLRLRRPSSNLGASIFLIEFACGALNVIGLIALFLYGFIRSVLLKPLAIAGLVGREESFAAPVG